MREILQSHRDIIEVMTRIVEEAAIYAMENGMKDESRIEYIKTRAADEANMAAQVSEHIAEAMINLVQAGIFEVSPKETSINDGCHMVTSADYKRPISERWAKGIEEAHILCPLQDIHREYPKSDGKTLLECKPSSERCSNCARANGVREGIPG